MAESRLPIDPPTRRPRVLVVEDDSGNAETLQKILELLGHSVVLANSGEDAIRVAESHPVDLVVSDIGLPGMNGFELMSELRKRFALPGIALTGFDGSEDTQLCRTAGFSEHIVKPVEISDLEAAINRVLQARTRTE